MAGPLAGIKVLEMANFISGPFAAMLLADLGADVVKVEMPGSGDPFRQWSEQEGPIRPSFAAYNRGKRSVTINVQTQSGRELYRRLASKMDVVVENFRPGTLDRLGIGYELLMKDNPRLIYCSISGMGSSGPYRDRPTYDAIAQAMSGLWSQLTDMTDPEPVGPPICDQLAGLYAAYGVLAALVRRGLTGSGQKLEVSMLAAGLAFQPVSIATYTMEGEVADKNSRAHRSQSYAFVASDGKPFAIHLSSPPKFWQNLTKAIGRPGLAEDPRFKSYGDRVQNYNALRQVLQETFGTRPRAEWLALLEAHDVPAAPIYTIAEALEDPQVQHLGLLKSFGQKERALKLVGYAACFSETPCTPGLPPPNLGEHNDEVFGELGYSQEEVARLKEEGAI